MSKRLKAIMPVVMLLLVIGAFGLIPPREAKALGQRQAVIYIRAIAADLELTPGQVENLTKAQVAAYILDEYPAIPADKLKEASRYWGGIKRMLIRDSVERRMVVRLVLFKSRLEAVYPDAVGLDSLYARELARQLMPLLHGEVDPYAL